MKKALKKFLQMPELFTALLLVIAMVIGASTSGLFLDANYLLTARAGDLLPVGLLAVAMTFVIIGGQIDLSVGSGAVLVMVVLALLYRDAGMPMGVLVVFAPLLGAVLGLFNGLFVTKLKLPSLVVTLGTLALFRGLAMVLMGEESIGRYPDWFAGIDYREIAGFNALPMVLFLAFAIVAGAVLRFTTIGRKIYAIGTNEAAARFSGIRTERVTLGLFVFSGVAMGLAALMKMSIIGSASYKHFTCGELTAITAVVLGGTSIAGGRGGMLGTVLAVLLLLAVSTVLGINRVSAQNELAIVGALLIGSVVVNDLLARLLGGRRR